MSRADRPFICLRRARGGYVLSAHGMFSPRAVARMARLPLRGVALPADLGSDPRTARRHLRAILRRWGWPGRDVRDACAWPGVDRVAFVSWPRRTRGAR